MTAHHHQCAVDLVVAVALAFVNDVPCSNENSAVDRGVDWNDSVVDCCQFAVVVIVLSACAGTSMGGEREHVLSAFPSTRQLMASIYAAAPANPGRSGALRAAVSALARALWEQTKRYQGFAEQCFPKFQN